jgi:hypothetical protein
MAHEYLEDLSTEILGWYSPDIPESDICFLIKCRFNEMKCVVEDWMKNESNQSSEHISRKV